MQYTLKPSEDFCNCAIKSVITDTVDIRNPLVTGHACRVYIVDTHDDTIICRFSSNELAMHNVKIGHLLHKYGIPAPLSDNKKYQAYLFETYKYNPNKTLFEYIDAGMSEFQIKHVYHQMIDTQITMTKIPINEIPSSCLVQYPDLFHAMLKINLHPVLTKLYTLGVRTLLHSGTKYLVHNDLNPNNVLINPNNDIVGILDMDSVGVSNENFALMMLLRAYPFSEYDEMFEHYEDSTHRLLNRREILRGLKTIKTLRTTRRKIENIMNSTIHR